MPGGNNDTKVYVPAKYRDNRIFTLSEIANDPATIFEEVKYMNKARNNYKKHQVVVSGVTIALILENKFIH